MNRIVRYILMLFVAMSTLLITGASYKKTGVSVAKKFCRGYSVIEFDKGIDCHGDTIKLVKVHGFFQRDLKEPS